MNRAWKVSLGLALTAVLAATAVHAAKSGKVKIGDPAPGWSGLEGTDDAKHSLADYQDAKLLVVVFTCNHCPVAKGYEDRLIALQKEFQDQKVQVVAINVNNIEADRLDKMKQRAKEKNFNFPYLYDASQASGRAYGATVTPHVFVLDAARKIAYMGAIDDNLNQEKVKQHWLRDALNALLAGKSPANAETDAFGCGIKFEKTNPST